MKKKTVLKIVCMYCQQCVGEKDGQGVEGETSTICRKCWAEHFPGTPYPEDQHLIATEFKDEL